MKVLHYIHGLNIGGAESFLYNLLYSMPIEDCKFDFCIQSGIINNLMLKNLIDEHNCNVHYITAYNNNPLKNRKEFLSVINAHKYDIVHFHFNSLINYRPIEECLKKRIKVVVHSHNTKSNAGIIGSTIHKFNQKRLSHTGVMRFACGREAGKWFFGNNPFKIINNGIIVDKFEFSEKKREKIRREYSICEDSLLVGHIGRFTYQKNHEFIINAFNRLLKKYNEAKLMLVGDGELRDAVTQKVKALGIEKSVVFCGNVNNVEDFLSAMDVLLFPSHYEGLPFTLIEAQTSGLPVLASDAVSGDSKITDLVHFLNLEDDMASWTAKTLELGRIPQRERKKYKDIVGNSLYDSQKTAAIVLKCYRKALKGVKK